MRKIILILGGCLLVSACSTGPCGSKGCARPSSDAQQLVIWWSPELRSNAEDYTVVPVHD
ncbi:HrpT family type III secretion system protein [Pseudomonas indica]|jgi:starvation-inducible outer membrane lipoprotein|uniref:Type III secretion protein HrpT n=1 Tax=Pseudomonas indica TaxID=137658 RepID=A0A1G9J5Q4_9PSED|nr:HrpT family type III secretion system protein [Pseudomonas indica]MBU3057508.1 type III secretion protein [Pseudomonas indica]PAU60064.1 hypothetical protein BZL42_10850 [Pseudomonas indica]SDL32840.1 hypothetical protein SAMN05216186_11864 [Pseudomonas indica]